MSAPTDKELKKAIRSAVAEANGEPVGLKALTRTLEEQFGLSKGALREKKDLIKEYLMIAMEESDESSESEEEIIPRKGTVAAKKEDVHRSRAATESVHEDGEYQDKTAGKSRAGQQPDHAGFLKKRGDQGRIKLWRKRHFRLYRKEGVIAYFKSDTDDNQLGEVSVAGAFMVDRRDDIGKFVFTITMKTTARVWVLQAPDETIMNQWMDLCKPLMKETAAVHVSDGKKPPKPANGLPLKFPPTYVQGFAEREGSKTTLQDGELDWTKLSHKEVKPVTLAAGQVGISVHGSTALVEEVREVAINAGGQGFVNDVPKQLKYNMDTLGWSAPDAQLKQALFLHDEKTQRELLSKLVGRTITASVPGTGAGHDEDHFKKQETRKVGGHEGLGGGNQGGSLTFPSDVSFTGKLFFDEKDERYALVDAASNTVHFLNTRDARTIKVADADVKKLNQGTEDTFSSARLQLQFAPGPSKTLGQLSYRLRDAVNTHINYVVVLSADEKTADIQGWYSFENKTSKTFENAQITVVPEPGAKPKPEEKEKDETVEDVAAEEGAKAAKKKFGGLANIAGALFSKGDEEAEPAPPKEHRYPLAQHVTLPAYDWAHAAFVSQQKVPAFTQHLVRFTTPEYTVKPQCDQAAGTDAEAQVFTVTRFKNPLAGEALPAGAARVARRNANGLGNVRLADTTLERVEGGEEVVLNLEKTTGITATRKQTGFNFDGEKHFIIETIEITVANGRNETVELTIEESLFRWSNYEIPSSKPAHAPAASGHPRKIQWKVRLNSGEDQTIKFTTFSSNFELPSDYAE